MKMADNNKSEEEEKVNFPKRPTRTTKAYSTVIGTSLIYFAMGLYFAAGNTGVYLTSYLIYRSNSNMKLDDAIWFLSVAGFSALFLPLGGWLEGKIGVRCVCLLGGCLQSLGIFLTYFALDTTFLIVVTVYGGSFLFSLATCYTSPMVNVCKWHPKHKGLVTGIGTAAMAIGPIVFIPLTTYLINPDNLPANELGLFDDPEILDRAKSSTLIQAFICLVLFLLGILLTFPAEPEESDEAGKTSKEEVSKEVLTTVVNLNSIDDECNKLKGDSSCLQMNDSKNGPDKSICRVKTLNPRDCSLEPKFAFRTIEFWILSLKTFITEFVYIYLLFMFKPYGSTFIHDDLFLSTIGAGTAISNTIGRLTMGHLADKFGYKAISVPLSLITFTFVALMPVAENFEKYFFGLTVLLSVGGVGSQYALMPSAAQDCFGDKYASINIGFVYMSTVLATVSSALLAQNLTSILGWNGVIYLVASFALVDCFATLCLPSKPKERLIERYKKFYLSGNGDEQNSKTAKGVCDNKLAMVMAA